MANSNKYGLYVEAQDVPTTKQNVKALLKVLATPVGDEVKMAAIKALSAMTSTSVMITNSSFSVGEKE